MPRAKRKNVAVALTNDDREALVSYLADYLIWYSKTIFEEKGDDPEEEESANQVVADIEKLWVLRNSLRTEERCTLTAQEAHDVFYALDNMLDMIRCMPDYDNVFFVKTLTDIYQECEQFCTKKAVEAFDTD